MEKKKFLMVVILLITTSMIFAQQEDTIIYNGGLDEVEVSVGDVLPNIIGEDSIVFSANNFFKEATNFPGVYHYILHGHEFFAKNYKGIEDIENAILVVYHLEIVDDPSTLLAENSKQDNKTMGDQREPFVESYVWFWFVLSGLFLLGFLWRFWLWNQIKKLFL